MGLGETQVFQDEKSRLANTTVARIVAAKGSLNDPETKKECWTKPPPAAPIPTVTAAAAPPATFPVICPHGAGPGSHLRVRAPNTGQEMTVIVPAGVGPGGQFVVPLPAPAPPRGPLYPYMAPGHGG